MGRLKKHITKEQIKKANQIKAKRYYWKNKEKIDAREREKYRKKVDKKLSKLK